MEQKNIKLYENYSVLKGWTRNFSPTPQEKRLFDKEFKSIPISGVNLLEIGFGDGSLLAWAKQKGAAVSGVEIQDELLFMAKKHGVTVFNDLKDVPSANYDIVVLFDLLEHVPMDEIPPMLDEIYRILKPNSVVLFRFPNCQSAAGLANQYGDHTHVSMLSGPIVEYYVKKHGYLEVSYREAKKIASEKVQNRIAKLMVTPFLYIFEQAYRLTFSDRSVPLTPNIILRAKKPND